MSLMGCRGIGPLVVPFAVTKSRRRPYLVHVFGQRGPLHVDDQLRPSLLYCRYIRRDRNAVGGRCPPLVVVSRGGIMRRTAAQVEPLLGDIGAVVRSHGGHWALLAGAALVVCWFAAMHDAVSGSRLAARGYANYCSLHPSFPKPELILESDCSDRFRLYRLRDARALAVDRHGPAQFVIVFVPGHHGHFTQGDPLASSVSEVYAADPSVSIEVYGLDFHEGSSAFDASVAFSEIQFVRKCIHHLLKAHPTAEFAIVAHSMGGVVSRHAVAQEADNERIRLLLTLNSPHRAHPFLSDGWLAPLYDEFAHGNATLVSIVGGHRDTMVHSSLGLLSPADDAHVHHFGDIMTVFSSAIPQVWMDVDHDAAMWCAELSRRVVAVALQALRQRGDIQSRVRVLRSALLGPLSLPTQPRSVPSLPVAHTDPVMSVNMVGVPFHYPMVMMSRHPCETFLGEGVQWINVPVPYVHDHETLKLHDFIRPEPDNPNAFLRCLAVATPDNSSTIYPAGGFASLAVAVGRQYRTSLFYGGRPVEIPPGTSLVVIGLPVAPTSFLSRTLWEGLIPSVTVVHVARVSRLSTTANSTMLPEALFVSCEQPLSGELRWYHNEKLKPSWYISIAMHPGISRALLARLIISPHFQYRVSVGLDMFATLSTGARLYSGFLMPSSLITICLYRLAALPAPTVSSMVVLPLTAFFVRSVLHSAEPIAPAGLFLTTFSFWVCHGLVLVVSFVLCSLRQAALRLTSCGRVLKGRYYTRRKVAIVISLLVLSFGFGPWTCVLAVWIRLAIELWRPPASPSSRVMIAAVYLVIILLKIPAGMAVFKRISMSGEVGGASWIWRVIYLGPGIGGLAGSEFLLAAPILFHMLLLLYTPGAKVEAESSWLRVCVCLACAFSTATHLRMYEIVVSISALSYCFLFETWARRISPYRKVPS